MTTTEAIAATIAAHTPIGTRYQLVAIPGTELTDACANCGGAHHVQRCPEIAAEGGAPLIARLRAELAQMKAKFTSSEAVNAKLLRGMSNASQELDEAHQHIGALVAIVESSASECQDQHFEAWLSKHADRRMWLAEKLKHMNATLAAARTWLRREAK